MRMNAAHMFPHMGRIHFQFTIHRKGMIPMAPRNRNCPVCGTHTFYSQRTGKWYAKNGTNCVGNTLAHSAPVPAILTNA